MRELLLGSVSPAVEAAPQVRRNAVDTAVGIVLDPSSPDDGARAGTLEHSRPRAPRGGGGAMCGIVGVVGLGRPVDTAALQRMNDRQQHRGPDGEGFLLAWPGGDGGGGGGGGGGRLRAALLPRTDRGDAPD